MLDHVSSGSSLAVIVSQTLLIFDKLDSFEEYLVKYFYNVPQLRCVCFLVNFIDF